MLMTWCPVVRQRGLLTLGGDHKIKLARLEPFRAHVQANIDTPFDFPRAQLAILS